MARVKRPVRKHRRAGNKGSSLSTLPTFKLPKIFSTSKSSTVKSKVSYDKVFPSKGESIVNNYKNQINKQKGFVSDPLNDFKNKYMLKEEDYESLDYVKGLTLKEALYQHTMPFRNYLNEPKTIKPLSPEEFKKKYGSVSDPLNDFKNKYMLKEGDYESLKAFKDNQKKAKAEVTEQPFSLLYNDTFKNLNPVSEAFAYKIEALETLHRGAPTVEQEKHMNIYIDVLEGKYYRGVSQKDYNAWIESNMKLKKGKGVKSDSRVLVENPDWDSFPIGTDEEGNKPPDNWRDSMNYTTKFEKGLELANSQIEAEKKEYMKTSSYLADINKKDETNSVVDVFKDSLKSDNFFDGVKDFGVGFFNLVKDYYFSPLFDFKLSYSDRGKILLNNTLVNLSDTLDTARFTKAHTLVNNKLYVKGFGKKIITGQEAWVYKKGGYETQKKLIESGVGFMLGDGKLINNAEEAWEHYVNKDLLLSNGLNKSDFIEFYNAYLNDFLPNKEGTWGEVAEKTWISKERIDFDTGNIAYNMLGEVFSDPIILLDLFVTRGAARGGKIVAEEAIKLGIKESTKGILMTEARLKKLDVFSKRMVKRINKNMFSKNYDDVLHEETINYVNYLKKEGYIKGIEVLNAYSDVVKTMRDYRRSKNWKVVRSFYAASRASDMLNLALLKSVFIVPYAAIKIPVKTNQVVKNNKLLNKLSDKLGFFEDLKLQEIGYQKNVLGPNGITNIYKVLKNQKVSNDISDILSRVNIDVVNNAERYERAYRDKFDSVNYRNKTQEEIKSDIDDFIKVQSDGELKSFEDLQKCVLNLQVKNIGNVSDEILKACKVYEDIIDDMRYVLGLVEVNTKVRGFKMLQKELSNFKSLTALKAYVYKNQSLFSELKLNNGNTIYDEVMRGSHLNDTQRHNELNVMIQDTKYDYSSKPRYKPDLDAPSPVGNPGCEMVFDDFKGVFTLEAGKQFTKTMWEITEDILSVDILSKLFKGDVESANYFEHIHFLVGEGAAPTVSTRAVIKYAQELEGRLRLMELSIKDAALKANIQAINHKIDALINHVNTYYLSYKVTDDTEIIRWQKDKLVSAYAYLKSPTVAKTMSSILDPSTDIGRIVNTARVIADNYGRHEHEVIAKFIDELKSAGQLARLRDTTDTQGFVDALKGTKLYDMLPELVARTDIKDELELVALVKERDNDEVFQLVSECVMLFNEAKKYDAFRSLTNKFDDLVAIGKLSDDERWAFLESYFQFTNSNPAIGIKGSEAAFEQYLQSAQLWLDSVVGNTKASTDAFTDEVLDFNSDMWKGSNYYKEIEEALNNGDKDGLLSTLTSIVEGGHIDPGQDVRKQMLMVILKDDSKHTMITHYNTVSKQRPVYFVDIETQGLNEMTDEITAIAMKEWKEVNPDDSLQIIISKLNLDESTGHMSVFHSYLPEGEIIHKVSNKVLDLNYGHLNLGSRGAKLQKYLEDFGVKGNNGVVVTEQEMLKKFMDKIDTVAGKKAENYPVLVTHNNNNFDLNFVHIRAGQYGKEAHPSSYQLFANCMNNAENSLRLIKQTCGDPTILRETWDEVRKILVNHTTEIAKYGTDMSILHPQRLSQSFTNLTRLTDRLEKAGKKTGDDKLDGFVDEIFSISNGNDFDTVKAEIAKIKSNHDASLNFTLNPYKLSVTDYEYFTKFFSVNEVKAINDAIVKNEKEIIEEYNRQLQERYLKYEHNYSKEDIDNLLKFQRRVYGNKSRVPLGAYKKMFKAPDAKDYFSWTAKEMITESHLSQMGAFTKYCNKVIAGSLKHLTPIVGMKEEFDKVIMFYQKFACNTKIEHSYDYLKYLRVPDTLAESYVVAQKLFDMFNFKSNQYEVMKYSNMLPEYIPDKFIGDVLLYKMMGDKLAEADLANVIKSDALSVLKNEANEHGDIWRHEKSTEFPSLDKACYEEPKELKRIIDRFKNKLQSFDITVRNVERFLTESAERKSLALQLGLGKVLDYAEYIKGLSDEARHTLKVEERRYVERMYELQTLQVMNFITKSADNLRAHLLFHNQFLDVPLKGSEAYMKQVDSLKAILSENPEHVVWKISNGHIHIGVPVEDSLWIKNDSQHVKNPTRMRFKGDKKYYEKPNYLKIQMDTVKFTDPKIAEMVDNLERSLDVLTQGANRGSSGILHNAYRHQEIMKRLPSDFIKKTISEDIYCDSQLWHQGSFDMSILGDYDNRLYIGSEQSLLSGYLTAYEELLGRSKGPLQFLDGLFNNDTLKLSNLFAGESRTEVLEVLNRTGYVVVVPKDNKHTVTGFSVQRVNISNEYDYRLACESGAITVPYDIYSIMRQSINDEMINCKFFKLIAKYNTVYKIDALTRVGSFIPNYIDACLKAVAETGNLPAIFKNQLIAIKLFNDYQTLNRGLYEMSLFNTNGKSQEEMFKIVCARNNIKMDYSQYCDLDYWCSFDASGGESSVSKILNMRRTEEGYTSAYLKDEDGYGYIGSNVDKVEQLTLSKAKAFFKDCTSDVYLNAGLTEQEFWGRFSKQIVLDEIKEFKYKKLWEEIIQENTKLGSTIFQRVNASIDKTISYMYIPQSFPEKIVRLSQMLTLADEGYSFAESLKGVVDSQFNYSSTTIKQKLLDILLPFSNYNYYNTIYWCSRISENPKLIRYLEKFWGPLTWEDTEYTEDDKLLIDSLGGLLKGGVIPVGNLGMYIDLSPSFLSALDFVYNVPETIVSRASGPIGKLLKEGGIKIGLDNYNIWNEQQNESLGLELIPLVGSRFSDFSKSLGKREWDNLLLGEGRDRQAVYIKYMPSLFGAFPIVNNGDFNGFQKELALRGLWYDSNTGQRLPLSQKNSIGLNDGSDWRERQIYRLLLKGEFWDRNKERDLSNLRIPEDKSAYGRWTPLDEFEFGGMNTHDFEKMCRQRKLKDGMIWDNNVGCFVKQKDYSGDVYLNNPHLQWDDKVYYMEKLRNKIWDGNRGQFVDKVYLTTGGLNTKDLKFTDLQILQYAIHGKIWNQDTHRFEKITEPVVGFKLPKMVKNINSKYIIAGDAKKDASTYQRLFKDFSHIGTMKAMNYCSGYADGFRFTGRSFLPQRPKNPNGVRGTYRPYGRSFSSSRTNMGLRLAGGNKGLYDKYYQQNYQKEYQYKGVSNPLAFYPQTKPIFDRSKSLNNNPLNRVLLNRGFSAKHLTNRSSMNTRQRLDALKLASYRR